MRCYNRQRSRWFALLSLCAALVFLGCYGLGSGLPPAGMVTVHGQGQGTYMEGPSSQALCGVTAECGVALAGVKPPTPRPVLSAAWNTAAAPEAFPMPRRPFEAALQTESSLAASHHASLLQQAVLLLV